MYAENANFVDANEAIVRLIVSTITLL